MQVLKSICTGSAESRKSSNIRNKPFNLYGYVSCPKLRRSPRLCTQGLKSCTKGQLPLLDRLCGRAGLGAVGTVDSTSLLSVTDALTNMEVVKAATVFRKNTTLCRKKNRSEICSVRSCDLGQVTILSEKQLWDLQNEHNCHPVGLLNEFCLWKPY